MGKIKEFLYNLINKVESIAGDTEFDKIIREAIKENPKSPNIDGEKVDRVIDDLREKGLYPNKSDADLRHEFLVLLNSKNSFGELTLHNFNLDGIKLSFSNDIRKLALFECNLHNTDSLKNIENLEELTIVEKFEANEAILDDSCGIIKMKSLRKIHLANIDNAMELLPKKSDSLRKLTVANATKTDRINSLRYDNLESINLYGSMIDNVEFADNFPKLKKIYMDNTDIGSNQEEKIKQLKINRNIYTSFSTTKLCSKMQTRDAGEIHPYFKDKSEFDVWKMAEEKNIEISSVEELEALDAFGYFEGNSVNVKMNKDDDVVVKIKPYIKDEGIIPNIYLNSISTISQEKLEQLGEMGFKGEFMVKGDEYTENIEGYSLESMNSIREKIDEIISEVNSKIPEDSDDKDIKKIAKVYSMLGKNITYDYNGLMDRRLYETGDRENAVSVKGALFEGKQICAGYALVLQQVLECMGYECSRITGDNPKVKDSCHMWNQVKIDENWYNMDLTWDSSNLTNDKNVTFFAKGQDEFEKEHRIFKKRTENDNEVVHEIPKTSYKYDRQIIDGILKNNENIDFMLSIRKVIPKSVIHNKVKDEAEEKTASHNRLNDEREI